MAALDKTYLYRITHIDNIPHILQYGITHSGSVNANPNFKPIGDSSLITTRNNFLLDDRRRLGDYIPFYFGVRTPMLYVVQNGFNMVTPISAENIVYCVTSVQKIIDQRLSFVFTDGHAVDGFTSQYDEARIHDLDSLIDWKAVHAKYWKDETDLDLKRRKEAEFLVLGDIDADAVLGFVVFSESAKNRLISFHAKPDKVFVKPTYYF